VVADVAIRAGRIVAIGMLNDWQARRWSMPPAKC